jgi:hypothetical protein
MKSKAYDDLLELASTYLVLSQLLELPEWQQEAITNYFSILLTLELE